ncbi:MULTISPECIES: archaeal heat shock protein Hsp20 [Acidianus]|uniref:Heat-shock protein Hsp20 n=1 Tax=Candidatus Acidianus copahuensis TaxID=1160895 RepID=A0A031LSN7_9CREN|nr:MULTISPECIES: archaeal heat shock protein Hsp20 [Acidianus]EZQ10836.1 heat-shock protein Hsp20 [Candidatus Acidianus copahuensis]NON61225.1 Hsp20/alpha crystallin family protein [Acidianus sp. RZ1]
MPGKKKYSDIFDYFDEWINEIEREFEETEKRLLSEAQKGDKNGPYVYGFSVTIGPDGKPVVEEFGNIKRAGNRPLISEEREPLVDVIEKGEEVRLIAEMPGVDKENIKVKVNDNVIVLSAQQGDKKYYKEVELPSPVDESSAKANYKNGVLEIVFKKKAAVQGKEIKVE